MDNKSEVVALPPEKGVSNEHRSHPSSDQSNAFDVIMRFGSWARKTHAVKDLDHLQKRVEELTCDYLAERFIQGENLEILSRERSILRWFFQAPELAEQVTFLV